jgi:putative transposase
MVDSGESHAYPRRLHHTVPSWVKTGSYFHIRLRVASDNPLPLTQWENARGLLDSVRNYHERGRWHCLLFLLMPDHAHALLAFPREAYMSRVIGEWKHYAVRQVKIRWQANYFDHRIRDSRNLEEKHAYILRNPVVRGLCSREADWPWVLTPPVGE